MRKAILIFGFILLLCGCFLKFSQVKNNGRNILSAKEIQKLYGGIKGEWAGYVCYTGDTCDCGMHSDPCTPMGVGAICSRCSGSSAMNPCIEGECSDKCYWESIDCGKVIFGNCSGGGVCMGEESQQTCYEFDCYK